MSNEEYYSTVCLNGRIFLHGSKDLDVNNLVVKY